MANKTIPQLTAGTPPYDPATLLELAVPDGLGGHNSRSGALSDLSGNVLLARGTIASPVAYLDLALPAGYSQFKLFHNFTFTPHDVFAGAWSFDDGATFLCDPENADTYGSIRFDQNLTPPETYATVLSGHGAVDSLMYFTAANTDIINGEITLFPGSSSLWPVSMSVIPAYDTGTDSWYISRETSFVNEDATVPPPAAARANLIRLSPLGSEDIDPPTSGHTFAGTYTLWGIAP